MTARDCEDWRGDLAMAALGRQPGPHQSALREHLDGCPDCQTDLADLESTAKLLALADPARVEADRASPVSEPSPRRSLLWRVVRGRWALGGLAVVAAAAVGLVWLAPTSPRGIAVTLTGTGRAHATAVLTPEHGGTEVSLRVAGQTRGAVYHVSMESRSGAWWQAGSYRATAGSEQVELGCGVAPARIDQIWVENAKGVVVLGTFIK